MDGHKSHKINLSQRLLVLENFTLLKFLIYLAMDFEVFTSFQFKLNKKIPPRIKTLDGIRFLGFKNLIPEIDFDF